MVSNGTDIAAAVRDSIYRASILMDDEKYTAWLDLCAPEFRYAITAYSHEIRREQIWLEHDRAGMIDLIKMLPFHNTDHSPLSRHVTVYTVDLDEDGATASAVSSVVLYQNMLDGIDSHLHSGETRLFAVGKYHDRLRLDETRALFVERNVRLETRRLDKGTHYPL